jgi:tellurite resistance protein TerC
VRAHGAARASGTAGVAPTATSGETVQASVAIARAARATPLSRSFTMSIGTPLMWTLFAAFVALALFIDFFAMRKQGAHRVSMTEAAVWSVVWVAVSFVFVGWLWWHLGGPQGNEIADAKALEFVTGYLLEKALAVDNIFVFLMVFTYFAVPPEFQKRVLMIGILGALVLRAVMILIGAWLIAHFHWVLYVFGAFLVFTGIKMWWAAGKEPDLESNPALKWIRRRVRIAPHYDGEKFFTVVDGVKMATPLAVVIALIGIVDLVFAVDSIPAIFAVTRDPFIVYTSNVFAILGLRALYFLLAGAFEVFRYLKYGLAFVLAFVGVKMLLDGSRWELSVGFALGVVAIALLLSILVSLVVTRREQATVSKQRSG